MKRRFLLCSKILFLLLYFVSFAYAQTGGGGAIEGTITDRETKETLVGVKIILKDTKLGSVSDIDGKYSIKNVPDGKYKLITKLGGFKEVIKEVEVKVGGTTVLDLGLGTVSYSGKEIVVTGLGEAMDKRKLSSAVETLGGEKIEQGSARNFSQMLQGASIPGMLSFIASGMPGAAARISTRGVSSVSGSNNAVLYIDGIKVYSGFVDFGTGGNVNSAISDLFLNDNVERIEVVKGGAASTLYGSEGANGVILVTTKKGRGASGVASVRFTSEFGFEQPELSYTTDEFTRRALLQRGFVQKYNLTVSGGSEKVTYNVALNMEGKDGIVYDNKAGGQSYSISAGLTGWISKEVQIDVSATVNKYDFKTMGINNGGYIGNFQSEANFDPQVLKFNQFSKFYDPKYNPNVSQSYKSLSAYKDSLFTALYRNIENNQDSKRLRSTSSVVLTWTPLENFTHKFTVGYDFSSLDYHSGTQATTSLINYGDFSGSTGSATSSIWQNSTLTLNYTGSYKVPPFAGGLLSNDIVWGARAYRSELHGVTTSATGFPAGAGFTYNLSNGTASSVTSSENYLQTFYGSGYVQNTFGIMDNIFVDLGLVIDFVSAFGANVKYALYPKVGVVVNLQDFDFYPEVLKPYISTMKVNYAFGQVGNFPSGTIRYNLLSSASYEGTTTFTPNTTANANVTSEITSSHEAGFALGFNEDKILLNVTYFNKRTDNALFGVYVPAATGFNAATYQANVGAISNQGIELSVNTELFKSEEFRLKMNGSMSFVNSIVENLNGGQAFSTGGFAYIGTYVQQGYPVNALRVRIPIPDPDGVYRQGFKIGYAGNATPTFQGGIGLELTFFKDLTLSITFEYAAGQSLGNQALGRQQVNANTYNVANGRDVNFQTIDPNTGQVTPVIYPDAYATLMQNPLTNRILYIRDNQSIALVQKADWIKVREISLRYRVPVKWSGGIIKDLFVYGVARNPFIILSPKNFDPETIFLNTDTPNLGGIAGFTLSNPIDVRFGMNIYF